MWRLSYFGKYSGDFFLLEIVFAWVRDQMSVKGMQWRDKENPLKLVFFKLTSIRVLVIVQISAMYISS